MLRQALQLVPEYREYVWGGNRLRPEIVPTAEAWIVYEGDRIASGSFAGRTLMAVAAQEGQALLGQRAFQRTGERFPLLIKLLDCAQWLSLQVHPDDEQAARLEGPSFFGKTEAWHVLESQSAGELIAGMKPGTTAQALEEAIRNGTILDWVQRLKVKAGDTVFMRPGTIHALGPGLLIYEVQQTSDLTYRVYDWGRPQTETRKLHIDKSLAVARPNASATAEPLPTLVDGECQLLCESEYFTLENLYGRSKTSHFDTQGESFHALTLIEGQAELKTQGQTVVLKKLETALIPADCGEYTISPLSEYRLLRSRV